MGVNHKQRKGIILAGGSGTRLYPITQAVSKQLLPIYDKPMTLLPPVDLMMADIRDVLIISTLNISLSFRTCSAMELTWGCPSPMQFRKKPEGLAQAF